VPKFEDACHLTNRQTWVAVTQKVAKRRKPSRFEDFRPPAATPN